jgi:hypothetical protein
VANEEVTCGRVESSYHYHDDIVESCRMGETNNQRMDGKGGLRIIIVLISLPPPEFGTRKSNRISFGLCSCLGGRINPTVDDSSWYKAYWESWTVVLIVYLKILDGFVLDACLLRVCIRSIPSWLSFTHSCVRSNLSVPIDD